MYASISLRSLFLHSVGGRYEGEDADLPPQLIVEMPPSFLHAALKMNLKYFYASSGMKRTEKRKCMFRESAHREPQAGEVKMCKQSCVQLAVSSNS